MVSHSMKACLNVRLLKACRAVSHGCMSGVHVHFSPRRKYQPVASLRYGCLIVPEDSKGEDKTSLCCTWKKDVGKDNKLA